MSRLKKVTIYLGVILTLQFIGYIANAATFVFNGKEITKGEAIEILIKDPKAKVIKQDLVMFDKDKGTIKNRPKN